MMQIVGISFFKRRSLGFLLLLSFGAVNAIKILQPYPENPVLIQGSSGTVRCIATDDYKPPANVTFMRRLDENSNEYDSASVEGRIFQNSTTKGNITTATLFITNITLDDDTNKGAYQCEAKSDDGIGTEHGFTVNVVPKQDVPAVAVTPALVETKSGNDVTFICNRTREGSLEIKQLTWTKDGKIIKTGKDSALVLSDVKPEASGVYRCHLLVQLYFGTLGNVTSQTATLNVSTMPPTSVSTMPPTSVSTMPPTSGAAMWWDSQKVLFCLTAATALIFKLFI